MTDETESPEPVGPPDHLANLAGMDLVRRTLEEARNAARSQGRDVGRGRQRAPRRIAGSSRRRWSGPGPDARDPQPLGAAATELARSRGWSTRVAEGAVFWQNVDGGERDVEQVIRYTGKLRRTGGFSYADVRRLVAPDGFCEQHTVRFHDAAGTTTAEYAVCVVGRVDETGLITRLDEYLDGSPR